MPELAGRDRCFRLVSYEGGLEAEACVASVCINLQIEASI